MSLRPENQHVRVLVVDDSALMRSQIAGILNGDEQIEVIGQAKDGQEALGLVSELKPDVVTLDVEMPKMNGITALKHIMVRHPVPTIMISALTQAGARTTFDALKYGAIDVLAKPSRRDDESLEAQRDDIINKVKRAAAIRTGRSRYVRMGGPSTEHRKRGSGAPDSTTRFIGIGAGTGGFYSLLKIIPGIPVEFQDVLIAVILAARKYVEPFVSYLSDHSRIPVKSVRGAKTIEAGTCYVGSGQDKPRLFDTDGGAIECVLQEAGSGSDEKRGAVDMLLGSVAQVAGPMSVGVVLSGPGTDGAQGIHEIRSSGGVAVVQDINNCMDPSMPLAVLQKGTVEKMLPDYDMVEYLVNPDR
ncbi:chemotaxis protein CheB [Thermodesulfobacteriota bacterium]